MDSAKLIKRCMEALSNIPDREQKRALMMDFLLAWYLFQNFRQTYAAICADGVDPESPQEYALQQTVFIPVPLRWDKADHPTEVLSNFLFHIEELVPELQGTVQPELWTGHVTDQELQDLIQLYGNWSLVHTLTGDNCAELLEWILWETPLEGREQRFFTPPQVAELLADMLQPKVGTVYDPCCGTGSLLTAVAEHMTGQQVFRQLYGHEYNEQMWRISKLLCYLRRFPADLGPKPTYALTTWPADLPKVDFVIANPPYNDERWKRVKETAKTDPRWRYGTPLKTGADMAWLQHMLYTLKDDGSMAVIMSISSLSKVNERDIRRMIVEDGLVEAVLLLPARIFYSTPVPTSVWVLRKGREREADMLLMDARKLGTQQGKQIILEGPACQKILETYQAFQRGERPEDEGFCVCPPRRRISEENWELDPKRYIRYPQEPLPDWSELARLDESLTRELEELLLKNGKLLQKIC